MLNDLLAQIPQFFAMTRAVLARFHALAWLIAAGVLLSFCAPAQAGPTFVNSFDNSWNAGLLTQASSAINMAEAQLSSLFSNNVTININFQSTTAAGLADANFQGINFPSPYGPSNFSYGQIVTDLTNHSLAHPENTALADTVANLPGSISCPGCSGGIPDFLLPDAESLALTGASIPGVTTQGFIRLNPNFNYDTDPANGIGAGQLDLVAVMLHEITHVMGRVDYSFINGSDPFLTILDLNRFNCDSIGTATPTRNTTATNACFSVDGGASSLRQFSSVSDTGDWDSGQISANNAFIQWGTPMALATSDILAMNALGWDPVTSAVPEPPTLALLGIAFAFMGLLRRKSKA